MLTVISFSMRLCLLKFFLHAAFLPEATFFLFATTVKYPSQLRKLPSLASYISSHRHSHMMVSAKPTVSQMSTDILSKTSILSVADMWATLHGGSILGSGGGGMFSEGSFYMRRVESKHHGCVNPVRLIPLSELPSDSYVACPYLLGGLEVDFENDSTNKDHSLVRALRTAMDIHPIQAIVPIEMGVSNLAAAFFLSAVTGLPVVDADPTGRSVPECTQSTFAIHGMDVGVTVAATDVGDEELFVMHHLRTDKRSEEVLRSLCQISGNSVSVVDHVLPMSVVGKALIPGTVSYAKRLGNVLVSGTGQWLCGKEVAENIAEAGMGKVIFSGIVVKSEARDEDGFSKGKVFVNCEEETCMIVEFVNETMSVQKETGSANGNEIVVTIPEIVVLLHATNGSVLLHPDIKVGTVIVAIVLPAPEPFLSKKGLELLGPAYIGIEKEFKSALEIQEY